MILKQKKHTILFVDDEDLILRGIKRSIDEFSEYWEVDFANSGKMALDKLALQNFDAVITDMLMPEMDGLRLLEKVDGDFPGVLRFVLSGNASDAQILKSTHLVHQMFPKPCPIEHIFDVVERSCRLRDGLSEPNLIRIITGIKTLPSLPSLYNQILRELQGEEPDPRVVAKIISQDTAMTAKILQLVNSAFFGLADRVSSPQRAVSILGLNTVKALVLSVHIFSEYQGNSMIPISVDGLWKHSMAVSGLSRKIARDVQLTQNDQDDVQVAAVLHDIGRLLELKIPNFFRQVKVENGLVTLESEYAALGT
ncbi:MAG: HDOD domain-containing protein, partial [Anaerolineae bacterium]|nr:HDOD domain-containing protein [Anaerolineae bacterium]